MSIWKSICIYSVPSVTDGVRYVTGKCSLTLTYNEGKQETTENQLSEKNIAWMEEMKLIVPRMQISIQVQPRHDEEAKTRKYFHPNHPYREI